MSLRSNRYATLGGVFAGALAAALFLAVPIGPAFASEGQGHGHGHGHSNGDPASAAASSGPQSSCRWGWVFGQMPANCETSAVQSH